VRAPAGVAFLARLEVTQRDDIPGFDWPKDSILKSVQRAAASVMEMPYGELLEMAVYKDAESCRYPTCSKNRDCGSRAARLGGRSG